MNNNYIEPFTKLQDTTRQLSDVVRWQATKQVINCPYSVAVHGYNCANIYILLCRILGAKLNGQMMCILLNHDNIEALTGDLLAPAKDNCTDWDDVEQNVQNAFIDDIASDYDGVLREIAKRTILTDDNIRLLLQPLDFILFRLIDMYEFLLRAIEEVQAGNRSPGVLNAIDYAVVSFCARGNLLWDKAQTDKEHGQFYADSYELLHTVLQQKLRDIDYTK